MRTMRSTASKRKEVSSLAACRVPAVMWFRAHEGTSHDIHPSEGPHMQEISCGASRVGWSEGNFSDSLTPKGSAAPPQPVPQDLPSSPDHTALSTTYSSADERNRRTRSRSLRTTTSRTWLVTSPIAPRPLAGTKPVFEMDALGAAVLSCLSRYLSNGNASTAGMNIWVFPPLSGRPSSSAKLSATTPISALVPRGIVTAAR